MKLDLKLKDKSKEEIQSIIKDAWLNIYVDDKQLFNPLMWIPEQYEDNPELQIIDVMTRPEYFSFICKEILNIELLPIQCVVLQELWNRKFPMFIATRGGGKSWLLSVYSILRALLMPGRKIIIAGSVFRQSKIIFEYAEKIWDNSPILRSMCSSKSGYAHGQDMWRFTINDSTIISIPIGDGSKIRGQRANDILADEFAAQSEEVFENVLSGFAVVSSNPNEGVKKTAAENLMNLFKEYTNVDDDTIDKEDRDANQIVLSGTAYYDFNHFARYWKDWKEIIKSQGNEKKLLQYFERKRKDAKDEVKIPPGFNWRDYSIIRLPIELFPSGFMDEANIARSRATLHSSHFQMEFSACFSKDSMGFFKRSLIESCIAKEQNEISHPSCKNIVYKAMLKGIPGRQYVYGIDPASEEDNFAIVILELHEDHRRIVYSWTSNKKEMLALIKKGYIQENDFYTYCSKKIRDLMKRFPAARIGIDSQGGGYAISDALHDKDRLNDEDIPIWPIIDYQKPADTDGEAGLHLIELVQFAKYEWLRDANHGLKKDFENKTLLFPFFDSIEADLSAYEDELRLRSYDTLEDCVNEIEELKDELSQIVMTQTPGGTRDKWDTPEVKLPGGKKGRYRKDRYSALLIANASAKLVQNIKTYDMEVQRGVGFADYVNFDDRSGQSFVAPNWYKSPV